MEKTFGEQRGVKGHRGMCVWIGKLGMTRQLSPDTTAPHNWPPGLRVTAGCPHVLGACDRPGSCLLSQWPSWFAFPSQEHSVEMANPRSSALYATGYLPASRCHRDALRQKPASVLPLAQKRVTGKACQHVTAQAVTSWHRLSRRPQNVQQLLSIPAGSQTGQLLSVAQPQRRSNDMAGTEWA